MIWFCPVCSEELGELNGFCEYCKISKNITIYNPDKYFLREIRIDYLTEIVRMSEQKDLIGAELLESIQNDTRMTPQEKLHATFFYHEKVLVKDMDTLTLRAHREELMKIAFEARSRITAIDDEENDRKKSSQPKGPKGFERSINTDETTTDAINAIKDRQKRMSKAEKIQASLEKLGISSADAEKLMSAGTILGRIQKVKSETNTEINSEKEESKPVFNPFEKKES